MGIYINMRYWDLHLERAVHIFSDSPDIELVTFQAQIIDSWLILSAPLNLSITHQTTESKTNHKLHVYSVPCKECNLL